MTFDKFLLIRGVTCTEVAFLFLQLVLLERNLLLLLTDVLVRFRVPNVTIRSVELIRALSLDRPPVLLRFPEDSTDRSTVLNFLLTSTFLIAISFCDFNACFYFYLARVTDWGLQKDKLCSELSRLTFLLCLGLAVFML